MWFLEGAVSFNGAPAFQCYPDLKLTIYKKTLESNVPFKAYSKKGRGFSHLPIVLTIYPRHIILDYRYNLKHGVL